MGQLRIVYENDDRVTELSRPVGPAYRRIWEAGDTRAELAAALDSAREELLNAAHPEVRHD